LYLTIRFLATEYRQSCVDARTIPPMSKIWYCPNCGYEVESRGRCHACGGKLIASRLPPLETTEEDDEVGYRLGDWEDWERGRLIGVLNDLEILHRFEDDDLVVAAEDEATVDDLVGDIMSGTTAVEGDEGGSSGSGRSTGADRAHETSDGPDPGADTEDPVESSIRLLADAAQRLSEDPTDMQADADVAEASTAVFFSEGYGGADSETWAAVGRVTRRLLSFLGADEAMDDSIRSEAGVLAKLLASLVGGRVHETGDDETEQTVYELPEWLPEQRAQLGILLEAAAIAYEWEQDDLVVPSDRESEVEELFAQVGRSLEDEGDDDGGEARYRAIAELFAASGRLAGDPADEQRAAAVVTWVHEAEGPPPLGMDEVHWLRIMSRARALSQAIEGGSHVDLISDEASALHGLLRTVV
jgi:hypothetical protein